MDLYDQHLFGNAVSLAEQAADYETDRRQGPKAPAERLADFSPNATHRDTMIWAGLHVSGSVIRGRPETLASRTGRGFEGCATGVCPGYRDGSGQGLSQNWPESYNP